MSWTTRSRQRGTIVVMVTLSILMLLGMMGLVVDIGWAYFSRQAAQSAADAAAQAGAQYAYNVGPEGSKQFATYGALGANNGSVLTQARAFAQRNGFKDGGMGGLQTVTITSGTSSFQDPNLATLAPQVAYWCQAVVTTKVTSLFATAAKAGSSMNTGATAIAAVVIAPLPGSIQTLNQVGDPAPTVPNGSNPWSSTEKGIGGSCEKGGSKITAPGGWFNNSSADGDNRSGGKYALHTNGVGTVTCPNLQFAHDANDNKGKPDSISSYTNGPQSDDPTKKINCGKQPPVTITDTNGNSQTGSGSDVVGKLCSATGGVVHGVTAALSNTTLAPGVYLAGGTSQKNGKTIFTPSNGPVILGNSSDPSHPVTLGQGTYIFLGGGDLQNCRLNQGTYVFAGAPGTDPDDGNHRVLNISNVTDGGGGSKGNLCITTDTKYKPDPNSSLRLLESSSDYGVQPIKSDGTNFGGLAQVTGGLGAACSGPNWGTDQTTRGFGETTIKPPISGNANIDLTGLKGRTLCLPGACGSDDASLSLYQGSLVWQDRDNNAFLGTSQVSVNPGSSGLLNLRGLVYQPHGGVLNVKSGLLNKSTHIVSGAITMAQSSGSTQVTLSPPPAATGFQTIVALVR